MLISHSADVGYALCGKQRSECMVPDVGCGMRGTERGCAALRGRARVVLEVRGGKCGTEREREGGQALVGVIAEYYFGAVSLAASLPTCPPLCLAVWAALSMSACLPVCMRVCLPASTASVRSLWLSPCLPVSLSVWASARLPVCL
eukprot:3653208-Rhodomonas_salina.2